ncbi:MAG: hypothetical protein REJ23_05870 [Brevundimonas sp.]|nr:hypothetical protein [Brevundimonas sp.]
MIELLLSLSTAPAMVQVQTAEDVRLGDSGMTIDGARAPFTGSFHAIVFNSGDTPDRLVGVSSPLFGSATAEVVVYDKDMQRSPQSDPMAIPPGGRILVRATMRLFANEFPRGIPVSVEFERAGTLSVTVAPRNALVAVPPVSTR